MPGRVLRRHRRGFPPAPVPSSIQSSLDPVITSIDSSSSAIVHQTGDASSSYISSSSAVSLTQTVITLSSSGDIPSSITTTSTTSGSGSPGTKSISGASTITSSDTAWSTLSTASMSGGVAHLTVTSLFPTFTLAGKGSPTSGIYTMDSTRVPLPATTTTPPVGGVSPGDATKADSTRTRLSSGAIAGIISPLALVFLAFVILLFRMRSRTRQEQTAIQWIFQRPSRRYTGSNYPRPQNPVGSSRTPSTRSRSRSLGAVTAIFSPTRMTELQRLDNDPRSKTTESSNRRQHRISNASDGSVDSQYPLSGVRDEGCDDYAPMSVRPFSPSETFEFPQPPITPSEGSSDSPRLSIRVTHSMDKNPRTSFRLSNQIIPPIPPLPSSPPPVPNVEQSASNTPFNDPPG